MSRDIHVEITRKAACAIIFMISTCAVAAELKRCGTDSFGNVVCMDKNGVLSTLSKDAANDYKGQGASGVSAAKTRAGRDEIDEKMRCGIDPFGNKVCR